MEIAKLCTRSFDTTFLLLGQSDGSAAPYPWFRGVHERFWDASATSPLGPKTHGTPNAADCNLTHTPDTLLQHVLPQNVPVQIRVQLACLRIGQPRDTVALCGVHNRTSSCIHVCKCPHE